LVASTCGENALFSGNRYVLLKCKPAGGYFENFKNSLIFIVSLFLLPIGAMYEGN
jgi:hypothetical protein